MLRRILSVLIFFFFTGVIFPQVRIRILTAENPDVILLKITDGQYSMDCFDGRPYVLHCDDMIIITRYGNSLGIKTADSPAFMADSVYFTGLTGDDGFSIKTYGNKSSRKTFSGNLECFPDLGSMLLINTCNTEQYIAGVVKTEGGNGKNEEYFKTQAVIARTYTYRYFEKHRLDRYNLCDDTHCQAFGGLTGDTLIRKAVSHTRDLVIVTADSNLIISAFHSNCGGETSPSEFVWLTSQSYLVNISDPYCVNSRNSRWEKKISLIDWIGLLQANGYTGPVNDRSVFNFAQPVRTHAYVAEGFSYPLRFIRSKLGLRSTWFSVSASGDSVRLVGKGYGHGVGLCQEGAMEMANQGKSFEDIIEFYYPGVKITGVQNSKNPLEERKYKEY